MAVGSSAVDAKCVSEPQRSEVAENLLAAEGMSAISALNDKSEPGPRQLPVVKCILALNGKGELSSRQLTMVEGISALKVACYTHP